MGSFPASVNVPGRLYRILVAEDDEDFLSALESVLAADARFAVAGRARNGRECLDLAVRSSASTRS